MTVRKSRKWILAAAVAVALLALSVSAAVLWLTPAQVAEEIQDPLLAQAFAGEDAILVNESAQVDMYTVTLGGLVSGAGISDWCSGCGREPYLCCGIRGPHGRYAAYERQLRRDEQRYVYHYATGGRVSSGSR